MRLKGNVGTRIRKSNELNDNKQKCVILNLNSQSAAILGRSFSITKGGRCVSVLLNTRDIPITILSWSKLRYTQPVKTRYDIREKHFETCIFSTFLIIRTKFVS